MILKITTMILNITLKILKITPKMVKINAVPVMAKRDVWNLRWSHHRILIKGAHKLFIATSNGGSKFKFADNVVKKFLPVIEPFLRFFSTREILKIYIYNIRY